MLIFDEEFKFKQETHNYMIFEFPEELHQEFKEKKELCIKAPDITNDAVIVSSNGTYLLKKHEISNTLCIAEKDQESTKVGDIFNIKSIKHYKLIAEKIFPRKKELIDYLRKKMVKALPYHNDAPTWSFCLDEIYQSFSISQQEIMEVLKRYGCKFFPQFPERAYLYR